MLHSFVNFCYINRKIGLLTRYAVCCDALHTTHAILRVLTNEFARCYLEN
jgi:hypothetical protein